jgi:hypothetical protein
LYLFAEINLGCGLDGVVWPGSLHREFLNLGVVFQILPILIFLGLGWDQTSGKHSTNIG